jgi:hypothetical protein
MIVRMLCTFDYNPETNEYKPIGSPEIIKEDKKTVDSGEPKVVLEENKYCLNQSAADLLGVVAGDRLIINYNNLEDNKNVKVPIIGSSKNWKSTAGNKLTKSLTVSCRGIANNVLSEYGNEFTLEPYEDGLYRMVGNKELPIQEDENVEVTEPLEVEEDLTELEEDPSIYEIADTDFNFDENEF